MFERTNSIWDNLNRWPLIAQPQKRKHGSYCHRGDLVVETVRRERIKACEYGERRNEIINVCGRFDKHAQTETRISQSWLLSRSLCSPSPRGARTTLKTLTNSVGAWRRG